MNRRTFDNKLCVIPQHYELLKVRLEKGSGPKHRVQVGHGEATLLTVAAVQALEAVRQLSEHPSMAGEPALQIVVALHAGAVIYGNVGAADRLDFTVIGPAVNLVSRVENVAKALDEPIVVTDDFAQTYGGSLRSLGVHQFRGVAKPRELFSAAAVAEPE